MFCVALATRPSTQYSVAGLLPAVHHVQGAVLAVFRVGPSCAPVVVRARLLVGADGINSQVRATLVGDAPRYLRCIDWNALIPNPGRE